ncbi:hypothetical protein AERO8C_20230 [Aeromonas veronii]|uniref:Uncharacterized protein n=1 Tax=Aeromonas veronii TaxID=654 RepID=A0A653L0V9_AERVE|nr:hypothetical protein AERO8C_20230 [Aeromonas veronii]
MDCPRQPDRANHTAAEQINKHYQQTKHQVTLDHCMIFKLTQNMPI